MKIKTLFLAAVLAATAGVSAGCSPRGDVGGGRDSAGNMTGTLNIMSFEGGYGKEWLKKIAARYKKNNPRVTVNVKFTVTPSAEIANIEAGTASSDLYFMTDNMYRQVDLENLVDISDVYDYVEKGQDKKLSERMNPYYVEAFRMDDGKYYLMPWSNSQEGMIYNKTVMDEYFPEGLDFPRTTDEMFEVFDRVKSKNIYAFCYSGKNDYLPYLFIPWWAQYEGLDAYYDYYQGYMTDAEGNRAFCKNAEVLNQQGRLEALKVLERMCKKSNGYQHKYTDSMDFMKMQLAFLGHGYNKDMTPSIFSTNGEWLENEMDFALEEKPQEIRFMRLPVISAIRDKTPTITDDVMLRAVVDYCDGITSVLPAGVSEADAKYVSDARRMANSVGQDHNVGIYAKSKAIELAKDFLKFMTTEEAGQIYANELNGLTLPYGSYDPVADNKPLSGYIRSKFEVMNNCIPVYQERKPILVYRGGLQAFRSKFGVKIFTGEQSAENIMQSNYDYYHDNWKNIVKQAGLGHLL